MPLPAGTLLGPYRLVAQIGAGGMGEVYKAQDTRLDRTVAVKVLPPDVATPDRLQRFEQEARTASALNHPNILTIHDVGREGAHLYFAMEWVDGRTLRQLTAGGRLPLRRVLDLSHQIAEGLAKAHAAGIAHRDLKPENLMVSADGFAKIVDFGLAKLVEPAALEAGETATAVHGTTPGLVMGTVGYMSPEQAAGRPVDYRSDQFALGLVMYELLTGSRPFERPTPAQSLAATIEQDPEPVERLNPEVPPHLAAVVARCLAKDPAERYDSTRDLARDLKQMLETALHAPREARGGRRGRSRRRWLWASAATLATACLVAAAARWRGASTPAAPAQPPRPLVAVRGLQNLSPDPAQSYFAAGLTEEIRGHLSQIAALRLLSRNAVSAYADADVLRMVRELGVTGLVEGSVRVDGNRVRIAASLVDAATQQTLWSEQYDRDLTDVFAIQSDVALRIARALQANLSPDERHRVTRRSTENLEAYQLYLQSTQLSNTNRTQNVQAMDLLRRAIALDPRFAVARTALAYRMYFLTFEDRSWADRGLEELQEALRIDPLLPRAHFALGSLYTVKGLNAPARLSFLRALELDPNNTGSMMNLSVHETQFGRMDEALHWVRRSFALSAKRANDFYHIAVPLTSLHDHALSRRWLEEGLRRFPDSARLQYMLALLDAADGRDAAATERISKAAATFPEDQEVQMARADIAYLTDAADLERILERFVKTAPTGAMAVQTTFRLRYAYALRRRGDAAGAAPLVNEAERAARDRLAQGDEAAGPRIELAAVSAMRQDAAGAFEWLARADEARYPDFSFLERDPILRPLARDARFREILERIRRRVADQRDRARERGLLDLDSLLPASP
jgi:TolB-like protein/Tfp pilus assembly protein PilF